MEASSARDAELPPATLAWLRQFAIGLGVYRLYAGQQVEAAIEAAERIAETAARALASGPAEVALRAGAFVGAPAEDTLARLAGACFERRIEHLALVAVPSDLELQELFAVLSEQPDEIEMAGGAPARLHAGGVRSIVASLDVPDATEGDAVEELSLEDEAELDPDVPELEVRWSAYPGDDAEGLYAHLGALVSENDPAALARSAFHQHAMRQAAALPPEQRDRFERLVLARTPFDGLAEVILGHLTDVGLADLVGRVSRAQGLDPRELATVVAHHLDRSDDLPRLTLERLHALELGEGQAVARPDPVPTTPGGHPLARAFPDGEAENRQLAATALVDVLANGVRADQVGPLVDAVVAQVRADVAGGDGDGVTGLLEAWHRGLDLCPSWQVERPVLPPDVLDEDTVVAALHHGSGPASTVLQPLAEAAMPHLVAALEPKQPELVQRAAKTVLEPLSVRYPDAVSAAIGPRSVMSRLALLDVLQRVHDPRVIPVISRLAQHRDPILLLRVIDVVARVDPAAAAPILGAIVSRSDDRRVQRRGLEELAARPVPAGRSLLERFADRTTSPLPRPSRRLARLLSEGRR